MNYKIMLAIFALCSYFIGNVNFALIISKLKHKDIRKMGSGNPGTLNMSRNLGIKIGVLTLVLDVLKGALPALAGYLVFKKYFFEATSFCVADFALYLCGLCGICAICYIVFSLTTLYYIGYPLLIAFYYYALRRYFHKASEPYICGKCGTRMRHKGKCPNCGAINE